jgi:predicted DNA-binding transcriptional regulator AlpA
VTQTDSIATKVSDRPEPLLVADRVVSTLVGVSRATWWRLHAAGKTPTPVRLGGRVLWDRSEIETWIREKCPNRQVWEQMRVQRRRLRRV